MISWIRFLEAPPSVVAFDLGKRTTFSYWGLFSRNKGDFFMELAFFSFGCPWFLRLFFSFFFFVLHGRERRKQTRTEMGTKLGRPTIFLLDGALSF